MFATSVSSEPSMELKRSVSAYFLDKKLVMTDELVEVLLNSIGLLLDINKPSSLKPSM